MKRVIVNADDFGLTTGVNRAIVECFRRGAVTSTTLMVTGRAAADAAALAAANPGLGVGLHVNLTSGRPALPPQALPSLVGPDGEFPGPRAMLLKLTLGLARSGELDAEIAAQIDLCRELGMEPTHVDSHHHLHAHPRLRGILNWCCREKGIKKARGYRMAMRGVKSAAIRLAAAIPVGGEPLIQPGRFSGLAVMGSSDMAAALASELAALDGTLEFMCHPGYADDELRGITSYHAPRQVELEALTSGSFVAAMDAAGAERISFGEL